MKRLRFMGIAGVVLLTFIIVAGPVSAWGTSMNIATTDSVTQNNDGTCSYQVGCYYPSDYAVPGRTFTSLDSAGVNAASLAGKDTLIFWGKNPSELSTQDKTDVNAWIASGGKLIIWDTEDAYSYGTNHVFDYSWLTFPFAISSPGALGAQGTLWITEENQLSTFAPGPYHIDNLSLSQNTDAVGDASIFTARNPTDWCVDMMATNVIPLTGPAHIYSKPIGTGIIIYSGLDWDYAFFYGNTDLINMLRNELNAYSLPCSVTWSGNIEVTKVADKAEYSPGETITFTITIGNPADNPNDVLDAVLTDTPPSQITLIDPATYNLGTIAPGQTITRSVTATAVTEGTGLINDAAVEGYNAAGMPLYSGNAQAAFDIISQNPDLLCISGYKLDKSDNNGLPGWTITLHDDTDAVLDSTTTLANGFYEFCGLSPGSYTVTETPKAGWEPVTSPEITTNLVTSDVTNLNFTNQKVEHDVPEFPSLFLPAAMIIGFLAAVVLIRSTREH